MPNYYYPNYPMQPNAFPTNMNVAPTQPTQPQIQNGGLVSVHNETEARNYPVGIGTSVTFKDENAPYIYNKTMGFSQLDSPKFEKYRLVKEEPDIQPQEAHTEARADKTENSAMTAVKAEIEAIWGEIDALKKKPVIKPKKKEADDDTE